VKTSPMRIFRLAVAVAVRRAMALGADKHVGQLHRHRVWATLDQTVCMAALPRDAPTSSQYRGRSRFNGSSRAAYGLALGESSEESIPSHVTLHKS